MAVSEWVRIRHLFVRLSCSWATTFRPQSNPVLLPRLALVMSDGNAKRTLRDSEDGPLGDAAVWVGMSAVWRLGSGWVDGVVLGLDARSDDVRA